MPDAPPPLYVPFGVGPDGPPPYEAPRGSHWEWIWSPSTLKGAWVLFPPDDPPYPTSGPPTPKAVNAVAASSLTLAAGGTDIPIVYGERIVEGAVVYQNLGNPSLYIVIFASGPAHAVPTLYLNGVAVASGVDGVTYTTHTGAYGQSVDSVISTYIGNYNLPGIVYAVVSIDGGDSFNPPSPWYGTVSTFSAKIQGLETYDPRENRITHSEDFSNSYWSSTPAFPTVATGQTDRFGGTTATRWTFGGSGPYIISRATSGLSLTTADPVIVVIDIRTTSGTIPNVVLSASKTVGGASATTTFTVTTNWRRRVATLAAVAGTGEAQIQLSGIPSSAVVEVAFASVQIKSEDFGYTKTVASAVTAGSRYGKNPILSMADLMTDAVHGGGLSTSFVNYASAGLAAAECDGVRADGTATFELNLAISSKGTLANYIEAIRACCAAEVFMRDGKYTFWVDTLQPSDPVLDLVEGVTVKNVKTPLVSESSRPTRVVVEYPDAAHSYATNPAVAEHIGLATGAVTLKEARYQLDGVTSQQCALRAAEYIVNVSRVCEVRTSFTMPFLGVRLYRGMLITLTTLAGLSAQAMVVTDFNRLETGEYTVQAREYDEALYSFSTATPNTPISSNMPSLELASAPPLVIDSQFSATGNFMSVTIDAGHAFPYRYGAGNWSASNCPTFVPASINDSVLTTLAVAFDTSTSTDSILTFDAGVGQTKAFKRLDLYHGASFGSNPTPIVEYSDNASSWTAVSTTPFRLSSLSTTSAKGIALLFAGTPGSHRYWRVRKGALVGTAPYGFYEVQFLEGGRTAFAQYIVVRNGAQPNAPVWQKIPIRGGQLTYDIDVTPITYTFTETGSSNLSVGVALIITIENRAGRESLYAHEAALSSYYVPDVSTTVVAKRQETGGAADVGHIALSGSASFDPVDASLVALSVKNSVTTPTVALAEFGYNGNIAIDIDKAGSLRTDESLHVAPMILDDVTASSDTTINSTTSTDITDATITFTPPSDCRMTIVGTFEVEMVTSGSIFIGELVVNGTPHALVAAFKPTATGFRTMVSRQWCVQLTGGTSYTIKLAARLKTGTGNFTVYADNTSFSGPMVGRF